MIRAGALAVVAALCLSAAPPAVDVNSAAILAEELPKDLAAFGLFADGSAQTPAPGVAPYRLNTPLWSDGAEKLRFLYLPPGTKARAAGEGLLQLPVGAALVKTFAYPGAATGTRRLIETRVLLHQAGGWVAASYQWNAEQTAARLVPAGARLALTTPAGDAISYRIPNRNQCKECHASGATLTPIGPQARNLSAAWLAEAARAGRLDRVPKVSRPMPLWEDRAKVTPAVAARAYMEANCAFCHKADGAASNSGLWLGWEESDPVRLGIGKGPVAAGNASAGFLYDVKPGDPDGSIMVHRLESTEPGVAMPEIGRSSVDREGAKVIRAWIAGLK